jgi:hypothetical protein
MADTRGLHEGYKMTLWVITLPPDNPVTNMSEFVVVVMIHGITVVVVVVVYFNGPIPLRYVVLGGATRNWGIVYDLLWVL